MFFVLPAKKLNTDENEVVYVENGREYTLGQLAKNICGGLDALTVQRLNTKAGLHMFQNFDEFNKSYNLFDSKIMRKVFLKADGPYLAEIAKRLNSGKIP